MANLKATTISGSVTINSSSAGGTDGNISSSHNATFGGNVAVNGGNITSTATVLNINAGGSVNIQDSLIVTGTVSSTSTISSSLGVLSPNGTFNVLSVGNNDGTPTALNIRSRLGAGHCGINIVDSTTDQVQLITAGTNILALVGPRATIADVGSSFPLSHRLQLIGGQPGGLYVEISSSSTTAYTGYFINRYSGSSNSRGIAIGSGDPNVGSVRLVTFKNWNETDMGYITCSGSTVTYGAFTGEHPGEPFDKDEAYVYGNIVKIINTESKERCVKYIISKTTSSHDSAVLGIHGGSRTYESDDGISFLQNCDSVYSVGDGHILVCSQNGNINIGDYICSSDIPGIGMKQEENVLKNYTVAKATQSVNWSQNNSNIVLISCTYHCG